MVNNEIAYTFSFMQIFFTNHIWAVTSTFFILGAIVGSVVNMLTHRLPKMILENSEISLSFPRSHCPHCLDYIKWYDNIPIISYLLLRARCRNCKTYIGLTYFYNEIFGAISFATVIFLHPNFTGVMIVAFLSFLWPLLLIDAKHRILPDELTIAGIWVGLILNSFSLQFVPSLTTIGSAIWGAAWGYIFLWLINFIFLRIRGFDGMGHGDFKMLAMIGAFLGIYAIHYVLIISCSLAILTYLVQLIFNRQKGSWKDSLAFGPFMSVASMIYCIFYYSKILHEINFSLV